MPELSNLNFLLSIAGHIADTPAGDHPFLPSNVLAPLAVPTSASRREIFAASVGWLSARGRRHFVQSKDSEVIYQGFLGPFLNFRDELGGLHSLLAHLPYLVDCLSVTSIILLPIAERGNARRKGATSSPFAISCFERIDRSVMGPWAALDGVLIWRSIVAACKDAGIRMGTIVPTATVSIDSVYILEDPSLVHWWDQPTASILTGQPIRSSQRFRSEAKPYLDKDIRFTDAPGTDAVFKSEDGLFYSLRSDSSITSVCNAFPDPVVSLDPHDAWKDVAAIRQSNSMIPSIYNKRRDKFCHTRDSYRRHLKRLARTIHRSGESAHLLDVSSALPRVDGLLRRIKYPEQILIAEQLWDFTDDNPFEFVVGPVIPCVAAHHAEAKKIAESLVYHVTLLKERIDQRRCAHFLSGVSNHDTVPCEKSMVMALLPLFMALPNSIPFIYSGTEFYSTRVTNAEFGRTLTSKRNPFRSTERLLFDQRPVEVCNDSLADFRALWRDSLVLRRVIAMESRRSLSATLLESENAAAVEVGEFLFVVNFSESEVYFQQRECDTSRAFTCGSDTKRRHENCFAIAGREAVIFIPSLATVNFICPSSIFREI